mgnify:CR=1 FL=1
MNEKLDDYEVLANAIEDIEDFRIYDFIYYLGIESVDKDIPKDEIARLINVCKECSDNFVDTFKLARNLTSIVYKQKYMSLEQLERVSSEAIKHYYSEERMNELRYYYETDSEVLTSPKEIEAGFPYTIARVVHNGYCVELHYCSDTGATIEYGTKKSYDYWENEIETADWFNINLSEGYILARLECLYDEHFLDTKLTQKKAEELNLIEKILSKHKVDDIVLHASDDNNLIAYDDENYWFGKDFYDFMFNELFVYNREGKVELIDDSNYKKLEEYRKNYEEKSNEIEMEIEYE